MSRSTKRPPAGPLTYQTSRRVEFRDTDAAGIMHFSAFFNYMEQVEHEFLRHLGLSVITHDEEGTISWPRVSASCDYRGAVQFEDVLDVEVQVVRQGEKSMTYGFVFSHDKRPVAQGQLTTVCCRLDAKAPPRSIPIPDWILAKLAGGTRRKRRG
ncbi:MAG TPA: thioesterase family protein [Pirellulales bacterium]|nr:thioesterase family protein [Pirellulales bacterium]